MRAILLAAGEGKRLRPLTNDRPKCLVALAGVSLIDRQLRVLRGAGIQDIVLVGGYRAEQLGGRGVRLIRNPDYERTNMVATLFCAAELMTAEADLLIGYGDIVYEPRVLAALCECTDAVGVSVDRQWRRYWELRMSDPLADAETLRLSDSGHIRELGKKPAGYGDIQGQYMGLIKVRADWVPRWKRAYEDMDRGALYDGRDFSNMYMTSFLQHLIDRGWQVKAVPVDNGWLEIDTLDDLELYHRLLEKGTVGDLYRLD